MGEIAEMMLDGILDFNGEYTGHSYGYPLPEKRGMESPYSRNHKVRSLMAQRGIEKGEPQKKALADYAKFANCERPTFHAVNNWQHFKKFINARTGYVRPSNQKKS